MSQAIEREINNYKMTIKDLRSQLKLAVDQKNIFREDNIKLRKAHKRIVSNMKSKAKEIIAFDDLHSRKRARL